MSQKKIAFFTALCFFLSYVEYAIPKPVPFLRLGLANLPIMLSFLCMEKKDSILLMGLKVLFQAFVSGTLFSYIFLFSLFGTFASGLVMLFLYSVLKEKNLVSWIGISLAGGFCNNTVQCVLAYFMLYGSSIKVILPVMFSMTFVTSIILAVIAEKFEKLEFMGLVKNYVEVEKDLQSESTGFKINLNVFVCFLIFLLVFISICFVKNIWYVYSVLFCSIIVLLIMKKKVRIMPSVIIIFSVTLFALFQPSGKILFTWHNFRITEGALTIGLLRSGKLCSMVFLSRIVSDKMSLPGKWGSLFNNVVSINSKFVFDKNEFKWNNFTTSIDKKLVSVWNTL